MTQAVPISMPEPYPGRGVPLEGWSCCTVPAGGVTHPDQLVTTNATWMPAVVPGTVAAALKANGRWMPWQSLDADASDWWYRTTFDGPGLPAGQSCFLCLDGLATLAEVWLNGQQILSTDNMFRAYRVEIAPLLQRTNELVIGFRSLTADLARKRPRPRWKTNLVNHQQLRWRRTTLLGRIPGWSPPVPAVGPWRGVRLETAPMLIYEPRVIATLEGTTGVLRVSARVDAAAPFEQAQFQIGDVVVNAAIAGGTKHATVQAELRLPDVPLWWPHTHGDQPLLNCSVSLRSAGEPHFFYLGKVGFRTIHADLDDGFGVRVNGIPVYCRGACWTVSDMVHLDGDRATLTHDLRLLRDAGANMVRVGGTMIYESDAFYEICDQLGILVWQDFPFANMDYPCDDAEFAANVDAEAIQQLTRLARHPSLVIYCGNSEVEQQAAMLGMPRELWRNRLFSERLPALCAEHHPGTVYVPSTPTGGELPFHVNSGLAHYYGVGAYLRSMRELRQADVKFTPECLAFANVPAAETIEEVTGGNLPACHHPEWKRRVPRDTGAGWDFEDVRDYYLRQFFAVDPVARRSFNMTNYLDLSRVVAGEMAAQVFAEWRGGYSNNHGGLVWFYKDLWPGAGWGIVDSRGRPKAIYYYLRRSWQGRQLTCTDEGLNGLHLHVINETAEPLQGTLEVILLRDQHVVVARQSVSCTVRPRERLTRSADDILGAFFDVNYAYRFGPPKHDLVIATLYDEGQQTLSEAFYFVEAREPAMAIGVNLTTTATPDGEDYRVRLRSDRFLQSVNLTAEGFLPDDNYFHLAPDREKSVRFRPLTAAGKRFQGYAEALNLPAAVKFVASR